MNGRKSGTDRLEGDRKSRRQEKSADAKGAGQSSENTPVPVSYVKTVHTTIAGLAEIGS